MEAFDRIIQFRKRPDLVVIPNQSGGEAAWTVKDPLTLQYFQLRAEEHAVLELLDGRSSLTDLLARLGPRFPGHTMSPMNVGQFVTSLLKSGLLSATSIGHGLRMADGSWQAKRRARIGKLASLMSIRFRGVDPDALLGRLRPVTRVLLSPMFLSAIGMLMLAAVVVVIGRFDVIVQRLPGLATFVNPVNLPAIMVTFVLIKVLHELGHAIACKHFGGECHEIGFILVAFMPLLYCDVTDSWMSGKKWDRIAVSMGGMFVELTLAAICTFLWLSSVPGIESSFFLNVMLICSLNTLLFNGNPLLRYDGYYVLSDLVGIPNLSAESREVVWNTFDRWVLGIDSGADDTPPRRRWFLLMYGVASAVYRWFILLAIVWFLHHTLSSLGLGVFSIVFVGPALALAVLMPLAKLVARARGIGQQTGTARARSLQGFGGFFLLVALVLFVPFPFYVHAPFVVQPAVTTAVFVNAPGYVTEAVEVGTRVQKDQVIATLNSLELQLQLESHQQELQQFTMRLKHLNARRGLDNSVAARIPGTEEARASAAKRLQRLQAQATSLTITSPRGGIVFPPPNTSRTVGALDQGRQWTGTPLDARNRGAYLAEQTLVCYVTEPDELEAVLFIDQDLAEFVRGGLDVEFQLISNPGAELAGQVASVATIRSQETRREIAAAALGPVEADPNAITYQARASIQSDDWDGTVYAPGMARIRCGSMSLARRLARTLQRVFGIEL